MDNVQFKIDPVQIVILGGVAFAAFEIYKYLNSPQGKGTLQFWQNVFGTLPGGTQITDTTGAAGEAASQSAQKSGSQGATSQEYYNICLQEYSYNQDLDTTLAGQGTAGWPWTSFDNWAYNGYPTLPTAGLVTQSADGTWHNEYQ